METAMLVERNVQVIISRLWARPTTSRSYYLKKTGFIRTTR